ncbi:hypothetical protein BV898_17257 [Hypsibius exemplaris]|uniref:Uncharacterized protein n=1 Tax=Hypsibius exemplaris TaxID=2072580 RepID=A0A9X6NGI9_HYPEX|nr:hypothetical protein BV898_17257 [Hypsibius exemplaris]
MPNQNLRIIGMCQSDEDLGISEWRRFGCFWAEEIADVPEDDVSLFRLNHAADIMPLKRGSLYAAATSFSYYPSSSYLDDETTGDASCLSSAQEFYTHYQL